jgi:hypothetical protein
MDMKTIEKKIQAVSSFQIIINKSIDETVKHPFLEKKLAIANKILRKAGVPKGF